MCWTSGVNHSHCITFLAFNNLFCWPPEVSYKYSESQNHLIQILKGARFFFNYLFIYLFIYLFVLGWHSLKRDTASVTITILEPTWNQGCMHRITRLKRSVASKDSCWFAVGWWTAINVCHISRPIGYKADEIQQIKQTCHQSHQTCKIFCNFLICCATNYRTSESDIFRLWPSS